MTQKRVDLNTCVWGGWHLDAMQHVMLPTLLSPGNLPEMSRRLPLRYRIATTPDDRKRIETWPIFRRLAADVEIEWITENAAPDISYHIEWYRRALSDAKAANAYCFMAYPDVAWSDGILARCAHAIANGKVGVAIPYIRVIGETIVPEMADRTRGGPIQLPGGDLVRLGMRHMHPLSVAAMAGGRHALPSLEVSWRVPDQGLILRQMSRELSMVDTERLEANQFWNTIKTAHPESLHIATDSDDMLMLSLAPLAKDFQVYIPNHSLQPMDLARVSLHPDNNNPLVESFAAHPIRLHYDRSDQSRWSECEQKTDRFVEQALFARRFLGVWEAVRNAGCLLASHAMSVGLISTSLASRGRCEGPMTIYIPSDEAFGENGWETLAPLLRSERTPDLERVILNHMVPGVRSGTEPGSWQQTALGGAALHGRSDRDGEFVNEARIVRRLDLEPYRIYVIDKLLVPIDATTALSTRDADNADSAPAAGAASAGSSLQNTFETLVHHAGATATKLGLSRLALLQPLNPRKGENVARRYAAFLSHFGIKLAGDDLMRQKRGAATALYQAGLYRHKLLFLYDLMKQFSALAGAADPQPAFFDYCASLIGGERELMQAGHYYRLALLLVPDFAEALYALGQLERRSGATAKAARLFEAAAHASPHQNAVSYAHIAANAWRNLAEIYRDQGNHKTAEACFRRALHSHGIHGVYHAEIAEFLRAHGHLAEAVKHHELTMPYSHLYPCEFTEPLYPPEQKLPAGRDGKPCDPLKPTIVSDDAQGGQLLYWWHIYLRVPPQVSPDAESLFKLKPQGRLPIASS